MRVREVIELLRPSDERNLRSGARLLLLREKSKAGKTSGVRRLGPCSDRKTDRARQLHVTYGVDGSIRDLNRRIKTDHARICDQARGC